MTNTELCKLQEELEVLTELLQELSDALKVNDVTKMHGGISRLRDKIRKIDSECEKEHRLDVFIAKFSQEVDGETLKRIDVGSWAFRKTINVILTAYDEERWQNKKEFEEAQIYANDEFEEYLSRCINLKVDVNAEKREGVEAEAEFYTDITSWIMDFFISEYFEEDSTESSGGESGVASPLELKPLA